jgi:amino acid transporter
MRMTVYIGGTAATFVALALLLSVPDIGAVISGKDLDPVGTVLTDAFGATGVRVVLCIVLISFLSCVMSLQAAASRLTHSYTRDKMVAGHRLFARFSQKRHVPPYALLLAGVVPALVIIASKFSADALAKIVSFASVGIYIAFQMVVLAALRARLRGWRPGGKFTLGRWGTAVNVGAITWGVCAIVVLFWPRTPDAAWYDNYLVPLASSVVLGLGLLYMWAAKPHRHSDAPAGDAIPDSSSTPGAPS